MSFLTKLKIKLSSVKIGQDEFGNQYFQGKKDKKRFVIYNGIAEPSKIPANWHGWMHYTTNKAPINMNTNRQAWQKSHFPNLTGTSNAYTPKGHLNNGGIRSKVSSDYEAWNPEN
ncbi:MAG: NADH:ubiquinone oxidoreductase subunit NDUFA12 [Pelagibacterales bacterium]|nr:NADH:ubiquinone oxidoreductase subunit NDUFA12 [Pelagibacterales bacterium]